MALKISYQKHLIFNTEVFFIVGKAKSKKKTTSNADPAEHPSSKSSTEVTNHKEDIECTEVRNICAQMNLLEIDQTKVNQVDAMGDVSEQDESFSSSDDDETMIPLSQRLALRQTQSTLRAVDTNVSTTSAKNTINALTINVPVKIEGAILKSDSNFSNSELSKSMSAAVERPSCLNDDVTHSLLVFADTCETSSDSDVQNDIHKETEIEHKFDSETESDTECEAGVHNMRNIDSDFDTDLEKGVITDVQCGSENLIDAACKADNRIEDGHDDSNDEEFGSDSLLDLFGSDINDHIGLQPASDDVVSCTASTSTPCLFRSIPNRKKISDTCGKNDCYSRISFGPKTPFCGNFNTPDINSCKASREFSVDLPISVRLASRSKATPLRVLSLNNSHDDCDDIPSFCSLGDSILTESLCDGQHDAPVNFKLGISGFEDEEEDDNFERLLREKLNISSSEHCLSPTATKTELTTPGLENKENSPVVYMSLAERLKLKNRSAKLLETPKSIKNIRTNFQLHDRQNDI